MIVSLVGCHIINVLVHALEFYIQHADDNDPLEREYICSAANIADSLRDNLNEERMKRNKRKLNPKN